MDSFDDLTVREISILAKLPSTTSLRVLASLLNIEPSNLSRTIKNLEDLMGVTLLHRSNQGVTATAEAVVLARKASDICDAVRNMQHRNISAKLPFKRFINFGSRGFVNTYLAPTICSLYDDESNGGTGLRFFDLSPGEGLNAAKSGVIDALVGFEEAALGKAWQQLEVGTLAWRLYASPRNPYVASDQSFDIATVRIGHHCSFDGKASSILNDGLLFDALGIRQVGHGAQSAYTALAIASSTSQFAYVPEIVAINFVADRRVVEVPIEGTNMSTPVFLSVHTERIKQKELQMIRTKLAAIF